MEIEQGKIKVPVGGISRAGSDSKTNDGLCNEIINLEDKDLTLRPYKHKKLEYYGYNVKKMFIHKTNIQENLVYINSSNEVHFINLDEPEFEQFPSQETDSCIRFSDHSYYVSKEIDTISKALADKLGRGELEVDLFYNMFSFRDGTWYMFDEENYKITKPDNSLRINLSFDMEAKGVAIAERKFKGMPFMQYDKYDGNTLDYTEANKKAVAKCQAKSANGLFNIIDSKIKEKHIDGICYMRYGIKTANGYSFISSPILITSPNAVKMFKHFDCSYRDVSEEDESEERKNVISIPPMIILGGSGDGNKDETEQNCRQIFSSEDFTVSHLRRFTHPYNGDEWDYGYELGGSGKRSYEGYTDNIGLEVNGEKQLAKMIFNYLKTFGYDANASYQEVVDETEVAANTSCTLFDKLKAPKSYGEGFFNEEYFEGNYSDSNLKCPIYEYSWMISGIGNSSISTAFMYACKEYGDLFVKITDLNQGFIDAINNNIITSVDVFITRPISPVVPMVKDGLATDESIGVGLKYKNSDVEYWEGAQCVGSRIWKTREELKGELDTSISIYYKLLSLDKEFFSKNKNNKDWININEKIQSIENIASQETIDLTMAGSEALTGYNISYIYNGQLHVAGGDVAFNDSTINCKNKYRIECYDTTTTIYILYDFVQNGKKYFYKETYNSKNKYSTPISFPSTSLKRVRVVSADKKLIKEYTKEDIQNGIDFSYVYSNYNNTNYDTDAKELVFPYIEMSTALTEVTDFDEYKDSLNISALNSEMYVSKHADPMSLDAVYQIGTGSIIGISSNTVALSQGQYGEFPLIVFTTEGVYSCGLATDKLKYQQILPISREICNNAKSICQVDNGVFFSSEKGLMVISGTQVLSVSDVVKGEPEKIDSSVSNSAIANVNLVELSDYMSKKDFIEYLKGCEIVYLYKKNKLLITNKNETYSYFYDLTNKTFTKISHKYDYAIPNYPNDLLVCNDADTQHSYVYEFPIESEDENIETMIETRAIKLGTEDIKSSYRVVLKGLFKTDGDTENHLGIYVFGSLDCEKWTYIGGNEVSCEYKTIRDIGCKVERMGAKYLRVLFVGKLNKGSKIDTIEISSTKKYENKIR